MISRSGDLEVAVDRDSLSVSWPEEIPAVELNATDVDGDLLTWSVLTRPSQWNRDGEREQAEPSFKLPSKPRLQWERQFCGGGVGRCPE